MEKNMWRIKSVMTVCVYLVAGLIGFLIYPEDGCCTGTPMQVVQKYVGQVLEVLRDPSLEGESGKKIKEDKIHAISEELFDFVVLSRRTLGRKWKELSTDERTEFVNLYKLLLQKVYTRRILSYQEEKVLFDREMRYSESMAEVQTTLVTNNGNISIDYRLINSKGGWKVYDVVIEGVSLITTYRNQFRTILANKSMKELFEILMEKTKKE